MRKREKSVCANVPRKGENWFIPEAWGMSLPGDGCSRLDSDPRAQVGPPGQARWAGSHEDGAHWPQVGSAAVSSSNGSSMNCLSEPWDVPGRRGIKKCCGRSVGGGQVRILTAIVEELVIDDWFCCYRRGCKSSSVLSPASQLFLQTKQTAVTLASCSVSHDRLQETFSVDDDSTSSVPLFSLPPTAKPTATC